MRIDLHSHSTASDGTVAPGDIGKLAREAGLDVIALTDHDTVAGHADATAGLPAGMTLVRGAELSCAEDTPAGRVSMHLLAYLFDPLEPTLAASMAGLREDRHRRAERIVERLRDLDVDVSWERVAEIAGPAAVGRPHVARAMVEAGVIAEVADAFTADWIGNGGRAWVPKAAMHPVHAVHLVTRAGGVTVLAHPGAAGRGPVVGDDTVRAMARAGLAGLEVDHPDHDGRTRARLRSLAAELGLLVTGSSDFHGENKPIALGTELTDPGEYERLVAAARGDAPVAA